MIRPSPHAKAARTYTSAAVETAGPEALLLLVFDKAIENVATARVALTGIHLNRIEAAHEALTRAQAIVGELQLSLDRERGGGLAGNLHALYDFCLDRLTAANLDKDSRDLETVERILGELRDGFAVAATALKTAS